MISLGRYFYDRLVKTRCILSIQFCLPNTVDSLFVPAVLLIFHHSQRPILLSKFKNLTNTAGTIKGGCK